MLAPVPVLMYHCISPRSSAAMRKFTVSPADFDAQLATLRELGYTGLSVSEFAEIARSGGQGLPRRPVVLTFDDGFQDFGEHAAPALARHGFTATLYVVAGEVGGTSRWLDGEDAALPLLDWEGLRALQRQGIELGAHSWSHRALDGLSDADLAFEVGRPRERMAELLGSPPASFCFPFGFRNARVRARVREAGYASACAVRYGTSSVHDDLFDIARHIVPGGMSLKDFTSVVAGRPPVLPWVVDRLRTHAGFLARQTRHAFQR